MHYSGREDEFVQNPIPCAQRKRLCTRGIFHHSRRSLTSQEFVYQSCLRQKNWEEILAWKKTRTETLGRFWASSFGMQMMETSVWHTWIIVLWSLGSNLQKHTSMLHPHINILLDTELLICFLVAFMDILRLATVSVKCSKMFVIYGAFLFLMLICTECKSHWRKWRPQRIPKQES